MAVSSLLSASIRNYTNRCIVVNDFFMLDDIYLS